MKFANKTQSEDGSVIPVQKRVESSACDVCSFDDDSPSDRKRNKNIEKQSGNLR